MCSDQTSDSVSALSDCATSVRYRKAVRSCCADDIRCIRSKGRYGLSRASRANEHRHDWLYSAGAAVAAGTLEASGTWAADICVASHDAPVVVEALHTLVHPVAEKVGSTGCWYVAHSRSAN